jgi:plasmid stabilization system protein ParE
VDFQIRITEAALADFTEIVEYSWTHFPNAAERFGNEILNHIELLGKFPYIGGLVLGRAGVRQIVHTPFVVIYRVRENPNYVEILHIQHGARTHP